MKQRTFSLLAALTLLFSLAFSLPAPAAAATDLGSTPVSLDICNGSITAVSTADTVTYTQGDNVYTSTGGCVVTQSDTSAPTANTIKLSTEVEDSLEIKLTIAGINIETEGNPISLDGAVKVTLTLVTDNTVKSTNSGYYSRKYTGIRVTSPSQLTIQGTGSLTATGAKSAGIGGDSEEDGGTIIINSGTITATGGANGAGIGGGYDEDGGTITINGGTVTAIGGRYAAGIGGGGFNNGGNDGGTITINGGTVTATGGLEGSGIGGGSTYGDGGTITITGGTVTATGGGYGAGIGGGSYSGGGGGDGGDVTITGGTVTAKGGYNGAAGIGAGAGGKGGTVSISNATITASGYYCAIGGGSSSNADGCDSIHIGENVTLNLSHTRGTDNCIERIDINTKPISAAAHSGNPVSFVVDAYGYSGLTYQWQAQSGVNWVDVENETGPTFSPTVSEEIDGDYFRCAVTNAFDNTVYTNAVQSHILAFTKQPESVETGLNEIAALSVASSFSGVTYQWQRSYDGETWSDVENQVSPTLVVTTTLSDNGAWYRCVITAANGDSLPSDPALITVNSTAVTYTTHYYLENADGSYSLAHQITAEGTTGSTVSASERTFDHYTEDTARGVHSGTVAADSSLILSRYYTRNEYTLTFETNGGAALSSITAKHGAPVTLPNITRYGHTFAGWYLDEELTEKATFTTMPTQNTTVYAKWTEVGSGRGVEYHINAISLLDSGYTPVDAIPTGSFYAQVSVTNLSSQTVDTLILAAYDADGRMVDLYFLYADPQVGQTFTLGVRIDNSNGNIAELRAYMIPMLGGTVPLANSVSTNDP